MSKNTKDGSLQATKQMLDELDALMEQMLSLPANEPDAVPPFPKNVVKGPTLAATLTLLEPPPKVSIETDLAFSPLQSKAVPEIETAPTPVEAEWKEHPVLNPPHLPAVNQATAVSEPDQKPEPLTNAVLPPSVMSRLEPLLAEIPDQSTPVVTGWLYLPLVWLNEVFDAATSIFWGIGWMRGAGGRRFLGISGIALFLIAIGWALVDWKGWNW